MDEVMMESFAGLHPQSLTWKPENDPMEEEIPNLETMIDMI